MRLRDQFPLLTSDPKLHYLDSGASSQMPSAVIEAVTRFETTQRANVHRGVHRLAEAATAAYEGGRDEIAQFFSARRDEIVFTAGTTAAINLVAHSFGDALAPGDEIVVSELEHHSNIVPWQMLRDRRGLVLKVLQVTDEGRIDLAALDRVLTKKTRLIALAHCSNVTGAVVDLARVVEAAKSVGAAVLVDGAQRVPHGPLDIPALGVDFYAFSGHKMYAPHGIGVLWGRHSRLEAMPPFMGGGDMIRSVTFEKTIYAPPPTRFEAGTPNVSGVIGLGAACHWMSGLDWTRIAQEEMRLTGRLLDGLAQVPDLRVLGPLGLQQRIGVVSFALGQAHPHDIAQILDRHGVACRGGHHCAQPLMERFDLPGTTRATIAPYSEDGDIDALLTGLDEARRLFA
ncbi:MAG: cysteine desulfurase [Alphaproteobacteria bacterium]|nr:cysteine desulfurase [Alphaproteobacteria bacterium]